MPRARSEGGAAIVAAGALTEITSLPEKIAVITVVQGTDLQKRSRAGSGGFNVNIENERVLIDARAAAVGRDAMIHDVTDARIQVARHNHHAGRSAVDVSNSQSGRRAERRFLLGGSGEVCEWLTDCRVQIAGVEIPLAGDLRRRAARRQNFERPRICALRSK